jgi:hypothetical protein
MAWYGQFIGTFSRMTVCGDGASFSALSSVEPLLMEIRLYNELGHICL